LTDLCFNEFKFDSTPKLICDSQHNNKFKAKFNTNLTLTLIVAYLPRHMQQLYRHSSVSLTWQ